MPPDSPLLSVERLEPAECFLVHAARVCRSLASGPKPSCTCLCRIFESAQLSDALESFTCFQAALDVDPAGQFDYGERFSRSLTPGELRLLQAVSFWQRHFTEPAEAPLRDLASPTVRRIAASSGRAFALKMAATGLFLRPPETYRIEPAMMMLRGVELFGGAHRVH